MVSVFKIGDSRKGLIEVSMHHPKHYSLYICLAWQGVVRQYKKGETLEFILTEARNWIEEVARKKQDIQFSNKKSCAYLLKELSTAAGDNICNSASMRGQ